MRNEERLKNAGFEIGLYTLGDIVPDPMTGESIQAKKRMQEIVEAAKLADEAGLDIFGVGEHHRLDYAITSPPVVLAAIAQLTEHIKLTSATTVLSTIDPVRLFEDFATLDLLSDGRAEMMTGRGAFIESFPLFGYDLNDSNDLFEENIDLLLKLNKHERITWEGQFRTPLWNAEIAPRPYQKELPVWVGVGGTESSAARAGRLGAGMALAILGGDPAQFKPLVDTYYKAGIEAGHKLENLKVGVTGHGYIAETTQQAKDEYFPYYSNYKSIVNRQLGYGDRKMLRPEFEEMAGTESALFVGSPQQIAEKILRQHELFGHRRFMAQIDIGGLPFEKVAKSIELLATEVAPIVKKAIKKAQALTTV